MERLRAECYAKLEDSLREQTVFPRELEAYVWGYYQKTSPSLQEFYSRYTPEWEVFYESEPLSPSAMLDFMKRMKPAFAKRYPLFELDIDYYIGRMEMLPQAGKGCAVSSSLCHFHLPIKSQNQSFLSLISPLQ